MNIAKAIYYNSISPEIISELILNISSGYTDTDLRKLNFFDLFLILPFYGYTPAHKVFERIRFDRVSSFQTLIERNPNIYSNIDFRYAKSIEYIKLAVSYCLANKKFSLDKEMNINITEAFKSTDKIAFNMGRVFSTKSTASLYNFFEVDVNVI